MAPVGEEGAACGRGASQQEQAPLHCIELLAVADLWLPLVAGQPSALWE